MNKEKEKQNERDLGILHSGVVHVDIRGLHKTCTKAHTNIFIKRSNFRYNAHATHA
jgi:hypothetical protein